MPDALIANLAFGAGCIHLAWMHGLCEVASGIDGEQGRWLALEVAGNASQEWRASCSGAACPRSAAPEQMFATAGSTRPEAARL